jgi:hypothetical protein
MQEMANTIGVTLRMEQQIGEIPEYPFLTFAITTDAPVKGHQRMISYSDDADPTKIDQTLGEKTKTNISMTMHSKNDMATISSYIAAVQKWFESDDGISFCLDMGYVVNIVGNITNRSAFIEDFYWEHKLGCDFAFSTINNSTSVKTKTTTVTASSTVNGVTQPDIIIQE